MKKVLLSLLLISIPFIYSCKNNKDEPDPGQENSYEYVDMGLSVKWAKLNIGATSQEEAGNFYAWGEVATKSTYTTNNYIYQQSAPTVLPEDAATVNWGGSWRMPTVDEWKELMKTDNCTWTWITEVGVKGYKVTSKKTGNYIFIPAAGRCDGSQIKQGYNIYGVYRTSTNGYNCPYISSTEYTFMGESSYLGMTIRPVHP